MNSCSPKKLSGSSTSDPMERHGRRSIYATLGCISHSRHKRVVRCIVCARRPALDGLVADSEGGGPPRFISVMSPFQQFLGWQISIDASDLRSCGV